MRTLPGDLAELARVHSEPVLVVVLLERWGQWVVQTKLAVLTDGRPTIPIGQLRVFDGAQGALRVGRCWRGVGFGLTAEDRPSRRVTHEEKANDRAATIAASPRDHAPSARTRAQAAPHPLLIYTLVPRGCI